MQNEKKQTKNEEKEMSRLNVLEKYLIHNKLLK